MRPDAPREEIVGPDEGPVPPFPLHMGGKVVSGFGRGSKELGIPTANIPTEGVPWINDSKSGVYFGWAGIQLPPSHPDLNPTSTTQSTTSSTPTSTTPSTAFTTSTPLIIPVSPPQAAQEKGWRLYPMVMSIGYNPFYKNTVRSAEVHVMRKFEKDFYGSEMRLCILGYVRPEYDYVDVESLIKDIRTDIEVSGRSLAREKWVERGREGYLWGEELKEEGKL